MNLVHSSILFIIEMASNMDRAAYLVNKKDTNFLKTYTNREELSSSDGVWYTEHNDTMCRHNV